jgi:3-oxoacyl-[acyl-carrier protein] reductase
MSYDDWSNVINTNLNSCFLTCKNAIPEMVKRHKGKIINISSVWGNVGASMEVAYSASKGGMNTFTKALAKELAPSNIQVNAVACGFIDTDMNKCYSGEEIRAVIEEIPADRMGKPQEVARLVGMLCDGNEYLTGQIITLDGGWI